jgi:hypothetical protein
LTLERLILITCILLWLRSLLAQLQTQRSLHWWYAKQSIKLRDEAEEIRNDLLQESFVLRRTLEISSLGDQEKNHCDALKTMEKLHCSLKELSDRLSPPFVEDSLPRSIQHLLESWQSRYPSISIQSSLPLEWQQDNYEHCQAILMMLDELLQMSLSELPIADSISIRLQQQGTQGQLITQFQYATASAPNSCLNSSNLKHLRRIFQFLIPGNCSYQSTHSMMHWHFYWQLSENLGNHVATQKLGGK